MITKIMDHLWRSKSQGKQAFQLKNHHTDQKFNVLLFFAFVVRRVRLLQELRDRGVVNVLKVSGIANPADALTKHLKVKETFRTYMARLYQCSSTEL